MNVGQAIESFWRWWTGELAELVPPRIRQLFEARPPRFIVVCLDDGYRLVDTRGEAAGEQLQADFHTTEQDVIAALRRKTKVEILADSHPGPLHIGK